MHIKLFRALKAANLSDDAAAEVVEAIEEYIAVKVQEANKGIESKLKAQTWVIGRVGFVLAVIGLAPAFIKLDRKSVVQGKRVSVRVDRGGRRIFKKKKDEQKRLKKT